MAFVLPFPLIRCIIYGMGDKVKNALVVLGPTASGKTRLGVHLADALGGEILGADSRQVYRGLDIGSGKDLNEYELNGHRIPFHLIDIAGLESEFSVFAYQKAFYDAFELVRARGALPIVVGGTGLYLEAVLKGYRMADVPPNPALRADLSILSDDDLAKRLRKLRPALHNTTDLDDRERTVRAIEISEYTLIHPPEPAPEIHPLLLGVRWERPLLQRRIAQRLKARLDAGLIEEVQHLHDYGYSWERLELLGLEYRFVAQYLQGVILNRNDLFQKLNAAIAQFAKRQETWFRRMERNGADIQWLHRGDLSEAMAAIAASQELG